MLGVNNYEPRLPAFSRERWALINLCGKHSKGKEKGKRTRRARVGEGEDAIVFRSFYAQILIVKIMIG